MKCGKYCRAGQTTNVNMAHACWMPKAIDTHSQYVILNAFPHQQWLHERTSMLRYTYIVSFDNNRQVTMPQSASNNVRPSGKTKQYVNLTALGVFITSSHISFVLLLSIYANSDSFPILAFAAGSFILLPHAALS